MAGHRHFTEDEKKEFVRVYLSTKKGLFDTADDLGISKTTLERAVKKYRHEIEYGIKEGQNLVGVSRYESWRDDEGNYQAQWIKTDTKVDKAKEVLEMAVEALKEEIPRQKPIPPPETAVSDLLNCYIITDYHFGAMAWGKETGDENWNINAAESLLINWFTEAIRRAPEADTGLFLQLGDFLHYDSLEALTPTSGHFLDSDTRLPKIVNTVIRVSRIIINMMLEKHNNVHIIMAEGNHDLASSVWLRALFAEKYADDPRVTVDNTHSPYYHYQWGETCLFMHHGHKKNMKDISKVFVGMYKEEFGKSKYAHAHMGHLHHADVKEDQLMITEQHPTLAAKDSYAARGGYISQRAAHVITYHKKYGEQERKTLRPEMFYR